MTNPNSHHIGPRISVSRLEADSGEDDLSRRLELNGHIAMATFLALAADPKRGAIVDGTQGRRALDSGTVLALALAVSRRWRTRVRGQRVGIALPPGIGALVANLAVAFLGRVPVNLNFTIGCAAATAAMRKAGIQTLVSAQALRERVPDFPWLDDTLDIRAEIEACGKAAIVKWLLAIRLLPARWLARRIGIPETGGDAEAALLFTSGSAGEPKGVVLTHRNIIGNCLQTRATGLLEPGNTLLACLPVFHSFGFTVTVWYPLIHGLRIASFPSPLDTRRLAEIIAAEKVSIIVGAPTFLRPFLKRAEREQLASVRCVISGAEKMPRDLFDAFLEKFGIPIREGYGLTETSPVLAVNRDQPGASRLGSVGPPVVGMRLRIVDPATHQPVPVAETGLLAVRGCNIFAGYLDDPEATAAVLRDGWFVTGDLAHIDADGFLYIEGRLSRFSKIGGEMVPHITVEQKIIELFGWQAAETQPVVVVGVADEAKGEALVVLSTEELSADAIRQKLADAGLPNLWIPKRVVRVPKIPTLNTGKLDLRGCRQVAEGAG